MNDFAGARQPAIGLLIGVEWGWKFCEAKEGERIAGLRTDALVL